MTASPWFRPKRFGYGATPASAAGWVATAVFNAAFLAAVALLHGVPRISTGIVIVAVFVAVARGTSSGPWRWRNDGN